MSTKLNLRIHSVKCVDETGGWAERFGNDEIYLGGFTVDAGNRSQKIAATSVYADFDDGDIKKFNPPKVFATYSLGPAFNKPRNYVAGFLLIEKDSGDMNTAVTAVYNALRDQIAKKLRERQSSTVLAGGSSSAVMAIDPATLVAIWSVVKPIIYGYVKSKIESWFGDEIFPLQDASVTLLSSDHTFNGQKTSPIAMKEFRGHEGVYQLYYDWQLQ
ncbi:MAG TPA: hypothetical protein VFG10_15820 [Saprospiraceae bacterium]|nr:hypothetical protein [Saprospiraceae bacterium]